MSYLNKASSTLPNFTKAVLSMWFRVPGTSLTACAAANQLNPTHLAGIIPLVTFGQPLTEPVINQQATSWGSVNFYYSITVDTNGHVTSPVISYKGVSAGNAYIDPSYLGVSSTFDGSGNLVVSVVGNIQATAIPVVTGNKVVSSVTLHFTDSGSYSNADILWSEYDAPVGPQSYQFSVSVNASDFADKWHHLLVSFDLSGAVSTNSAGATIPDCVTSYNRMWVALDGVNYNGTSGAFPNFVGGSDLNAVITNGAMTVASTPQPPYALPLPQLVPQVYPADSTNPAPGTFSPGGNLPNCNTGTSSDPITFNVAPSAVPTLGYQFGLPATPDQTGSIYHVEMSEFQVFTGVTVDTGNPANVVAFIDFKRDKNGHATSSFMEPVDPTKPAWNAGTSTRPPAVVLLGKSPDILLHGSRNWIAGKNTGTIADQFGPTGKIQKYKPDPGLPPAPQGAPQ
jgi:hypothetical protein